MSGAFYVLAFSFIGRSPGFGFRANESRLASLLSCTRRLHNVLSCRVGDSFEFTEKAFRVVARADAVVWSLGLRLTGADRAALHTISTRFLQLRRLTLRDCKDIKALNALLCRDADDDNGRSSNSSDELNSICNDSVRYDLKMLMLFQCVVSSELLAKLSPRLTKLSCSGCRGLTLPIDSRLLPRSLVDFHLTSCFSAVRNDMGELQREQPQLPDLTQLPPKLRELIFYGNCFVLPQEVEIDDVSVRRRVLDLTNLPQTLVRLDLSSNKLTGPLNLTQLNPCLRDLSLETNEFSVAEDDEPLDLSQLPPFMKALNIGFNTGLQCAVILGKLPRTLTYMNLVGTGLFGTFDESEQDFIEEPKLALAANIKRKVNSEAFVSK